MAFKLSPARSSHSWDTRPGAFHQTWSLSTFHVRNPQEVIQNCQQHQKHTEYSFLWPLSLPRVLWKCRFSTTFAIATHHKRHFEKAHSDYWPLLSAYAVYNCGNDDNSRRPVNGNEFKNIINSPSKKWRALACLFYQWWPICKEFLRHDDPSGHEKKSYYVGVYDGRLARQVAFPYRLVIVAYCSLQETKVSVRETVYIRPIRPQDCGQLT